MRRLIAVAAVAAALLSGCSSDGDEGAEPSAEQTATTTESTESTEPDEVSTSDACDLLSDADVEGLLGSAAGDATPGTVGDVPNCVWEGDEGRYVQVIAVESDVWAKQLPETFEQIRASDLVSDAENLRKLKQGAAMVADGKDLGPERACALFSTLIEELQGQPPGTTAIVTVIPTPSDPKAVSGQVCTDGRFTSVMIAQPNGFDGDLPTDEIGALAQSVHAESVG